MGKRNITVAYGDGIGPEIMNSTIAIMEAAGAQLNYDKIQVGEQVYLNGNQSGISDESWDTLRKNKIFLKAPITTPQGGGYKSLNVTIRKSFGLYSNIRPSKAYSPYVTTHFPKMDLVIVRENEEDLYAGIEYQQTSEVVQCLKLISRPGSEKIIRYAFEYAMANNRKHVTCMTKDNIMKHADGLFHSIFKEVAKEYPEITSDHYIVDIGAARLANDPERFDVIVTLNLYGDILSDIASDISGSVGLGGSANIGDDFAMFEAIHGSAPDIAGKGIANPSGLLNGACMMLVHLGQGTVAAKIQNALLKTLEDGIHTGDIYKEGLSTQEVGTEAFEAALIERLGQKPTKFPVVELSEAKPISIKLKSADPVKKELVGVDVFLNYDEDGRDPDALGARMDTVSTGSLKLKVISNRGVQVYPDGKPETFKSDHWIVRFKGTNKSVSHADIIELLGSISDAGLDFIKMENLYFMDGERGYTLAQGEN
jgi:isocitrate dehydrogenase